MRRNWKNIIFIFFVFCFWITTDCVYAETTSKKVCLPSGLYTITWDSAISTNFKISDVNEETIRNKHTAPVGIDDTTSYQFDSVLVANSCYQESDGDYYSCPTPEDLSVSFNDFIKLNGNTYQNITTSLNTSSYPYTYDVKIKNIYQKVSTEVSLRYVANSSNRNLGELNYNQISSGFLDFHNNSWTIPKVKPGSKIYIEVYVKNSSNSNCNGSYLGYFEFYVDDLNNYKIANPAYTNPEKYGCDVIKNNTKVPNNYKKEAIPECYSTEILYPEYEGLKSAIEQKWNRVLAIYNDFPDQSSFPASNFVCTNGKKTSVNNNVSISQVGSYWSLSCYETYTADPSGPKLVKAGGGFEYDSTYTISRTCTITQINKPVKKPQCNITYSSACTYPSGEITNINDPSRGGPTEDFDSCVSSCDGGTYSQSCINSCYQKVYGQESNRQLGLLSKLMYQVNRATVHPLISLPTKVSTTKIGTTIIGTGPSNNCGGWHDCISGHGVKRKCKTCYTTIDGYTFSNEISDYCGNHSVSCTYYKTTSPEGCAINSDSEYNNALQASQDELRRFETLAASYENIETGSHEIRIQDSYLKNSKGKSYIFDVDSSSNPKVTIHTQNQQSTDTSQKASTILGASGGTSVTYNQKTVRTKVITVKLPASYISKVTGEATYATDNDTKNGYSINLKSNEFFTKLPTFEINRYYQKQYRYYTSFWSNNINVDILDSQVILQDNPDYPNNIKIISSKVGTGGGFESDIDCYYGVYNNYYCKDPKDCPDEGGTGIRYIFRPIRLDDIFPNNRKPRFNWTGTVNTATNTATGAALTQDQSYYGTAVDPQALIDAIQSKGESIYDVLTDSSEVDYDFVLTKENIRNIRKYNKNVRDINGDGDNNYLDYNMSCTTNSRGQQVCYSKFLDNINGNSGTDASDSFITYSTNGFGVTERHNIVGCNNAKAGECDTTIHN